MCVCVCVRARAVIEERAPRRTYLAHVVVALGHIATWQGQRRGLLPARTLRVFKDCVALAWATGDEYARTTGSA